MEWNKEKVDYLAWLRDIKKDDQELMALCKYLEDIFKGIPLIIGVYKCDHTIKYYNQMGYEFFKPKKKDTVVEKCFQMLGRNERCQDCPVDESILTGEIVRKDRYIVEIGKFMECSCNPIKNDIGEVLFIVETLRDISNEKMIEALLAESTSNYRRIVNLSPYPIIITIDGVIVLANKQTYEYFDSPLGENIVNYIHLDYVSIMGKRCKQILDNKAIKAVYDYKIIGNNNQIYDVEVASSYFIYKGKPAILSIIKDISQRKKELNEAANFQLKLMKKQLLNLGKFKLEMLYIPARIVSGDFYFFHKINENLIVGILGDVAGKGVAAALSISAFNILFFEALTVSHNPTDIVQILNHKIEKYMDDQYIAACCFSFDFIHNEVKVVGAGINQLYYGNQSENFTKIEIKGAFLGMFHDSDFEEYLIRFKSGDKFVFFTDGLEFILSDWIMESKYIKNTTLDEMVRFLSDDIKGKLSNIDSIMDDCTLLALEIQ